VQTLRGRAERDQVQRQLSATQARVATVTQHLRTVRGTLAATANQRGALQQYYQADLAQIAQLEHEIAIDAANLSANTEHISALRSCLSSVQRALDTVSVGVAPPTVDMLTTASAACSVAQAGAPGA
jgi:chromosome segregation ATPase